MINPVKKLFEPLIAPNVGCPQAQTEYYIVEEYGILYR